MNSNISVFFFVKIILTPGTIEYIKVGRLKAGVKGKKSISLFDRLLFLNILRLITMQLIKLSLAIFAVGTLLAATPAQAEPFYCSCYDNNGNANGPVTAQCCGKYGISLNGNTCTLEENLVMLKEAAGCCSEQGTTGRCT
ncbi:hypothetical protein BDB00DRAFT_826252 [Zychaea mexicana]|uniref:uncharacterized protein n=1 Tax=Zychaea mexicana TaxID=64656 RepID=UPI0022FE13B7|nr:uncharacterized protein BDB00DRAFT_826252 [Zychaea mexicana]KAI9492944.1 hypothetical protein BDB00DRAFT_826252 [Zychaea mexicana]